jgi:dienelactone hydrolase
MKQALILGLMLLTFSSKAQNPQIPVTVPYDSWAGAEVPGWLYLPADYATSTKKYPVVFFYHGLGEAGTDRNMLLSQGLPKLIAEGMRPDNITNPADGQQYSFIVLSVQHWSWSPNASWLPKQLEWLNTHYRIDQSRVYVTGMSAGGQACFNVAVNDNNLARLIAAAVPMSPGTAWPYNIGLVADNKIETWFFSGDTDGGFTTNATNYSTDCNSLYPGSSKLNIYSGGHCCWNTYYHTSWRDPVTAQSVWEWMLTNVNETLANPLPVYFISANIKAEEMGLRISWQVSGEKDVDHYEVEKSTDGRTYSVIGLAAASKQTAYHITYSSFQNKGFYRIKSVDHDGKKVYSSVINYTKGQASVVLKAFPIPASNELIIQHPTATKGTTIRMHSADGRLVHSATPAQGVQQTLLNITALKKGSYFLHYEDASGTMETLTIVK